MSENFVDKLQKELLSIQTEGKKNESVLVEGGWGGVLGRGGEGKEEVVAEARCQILANNCGKSGDKV
jgi:hypothetical protein